MRRAKLSNERRRDIRDAYLFIAPTFVGFFLFVIGPLAASIAISFSHWNLLLPNERRFAGMANYVQLFSGVASEQFFTVYVNTAIFVAAETVLFLIIGFAVASILNRPFSPFLRYLIRLGYFLPFVTATAIVAGVWAFLFNTDIGVINYYLGVLGVGKVPWLNSTSWAKAAVIVFDVWKNFGFYALVFLAGLQSIPRELYEAAEMDGARPFAKLFRITLPLLSPTTFFLLVIGFINTIQIFDSPFVLTGGQPGDSTRSVVMYIYDNGFRYFNLGYASAVAVTLFVVIVAATAAQFGAQKLWVRYE